ncbi:MAG: 2-amino-4-hydroxy-6-hydroxymethyldihydropteridine diphosphokinase, partial [Tistlia sp.]
MTSIYVALGANLPHPTLGEPRAVLEAALEALAARGVAVRRRSRWYRSAPVPASDQPWFVNGVAEVESALPPGELLSLLHGIEEDFGRVRSLPNAPRVLDLDLLDWNGALSPTGAWPVLPHPRLQ